MQSGGRVKYKQIYNLLGLGPHCTIKQKRLIIQEPDPKNFERNDNLQTELSDFSGSVCEHYKE